MASSVKQATPAHDKKDKATEVALVQAIRNGQFRVWSTSLFLAIQGIIARSWPPTFSML